jgi:hypothetical protein
MGGWGWSGDDQPIQHSSSLFSLFLLAFFFSFPFCILDGRFGALLMGG